MPSISRLIIYDSDDEDVLKEQIEKSLPKGIHELDVKITIIDLADIPDLNKVVSEILTS